MTAQPARAKDKHAWAMAWGRESLAYTSPHWTYSQPAAMLAMARRTRDEEAFSLNQRNSPSTTRTTVQVALRSPKILRGAFFLKSASATSTGNRPRKKLLSTRSRLPSPRTIWA